ncbi:MFS general substrate transporter [Jaminaea rosea]|uniref:MFS general substrate transporter n=1 Tax=Jaminaea rosea TaxID=1569628 RepID=A0A316UT46_9BASI|nr:MFS general substrate transporter [Jaminaea rosea]PWN28469.1 MFS general substrate transporter [Jaminaea rosea]
MLANSRDSASAPPSPVDDTRDSPISAASTVADGDRSTTPAHKAELEPAGKKKEHWLEKDVHVIPKNNLLVVFSALMLCVFLAALDQTIVSTALPTIASDLRMGAAGYSWVGTAYLLTSTGMIPLYGRLSDLVGRKPLFFFAIIVFLFGSGMVAAAQNTIWICACRGVQGIGGGGIIGLVQVVTSDIVPLHKRGAFQGLFGAVWGVASVLGPLIGGALADLPNTGGASSLGWRWAFLLNVPLGAVALVILYFKLNLNPVEKRSVKQVVKEFDWIGWVLLLAAIVIFLFGFSQAETVGFNAAQTIALIVVGAVLFPVAVTWSFFCQRLFPSVRPILPPRVFRTRTTTFILMTVLLHGFAFFAVTYELPIYFQAVKGANPTLSGVYMLPYALIGSIVSAVSGITVVKLKKWRPVFWYGWTMSVLGYSLMTLIDGESSWAEIECTTAVAALGYGALFQVPLLGMLSAMPTSEQAATTSTLALVRSMSGSMGISVAGAVFNARAKELTANIPGYDTPSNPSADLRGLVDIQPPSLSREVIHEYGKALNLVWIVLAPIVAAGFLFSLPVKSYSLNRQNHAEEKQREDNVEEMQVTEAAAGGAAAPTKEQDHVPTREVEEGPKTPAATRNGEGPNA